MDGAVVPLAPPPLSPLIPKPPCPQRKKHLALHFLRIDIFVTLLQASTTVVSGQVTTPKHR